jgi:hypothetical protein
MDALDRRDVVRQGLLGAGALTLGSGLLGATRALAQTEDTSATDSEILVRSLTFEQQAVLALESAVASRTLGSFSSAAQKFAAQDKVHVGLLTAALKKIGGQPLPAPQADDVPGLTQAQSREDWLDLLVRTQNQVLAAYVEGQKELGAADLLTLSAQMAANVGQHLVVLRQALGTDPLPAALPSGSEKN